MSVEPNPPTVPESGSEPAPEAAPQARAGRRFDRSIVEGSLPGAVWKLAWPGMLQNLIAGLQGLIDHAMVGHYVGFTGNAAIGVSWQIFLVVVVFISSLYSGMAVLVARFAGADEPRKVNRVVYQGFLTSIVLTLGVLAPLGFFLTPQLLDLANAAPEVQQEALPYLRIMFVYSFGMLIFFLLGGALRAAGDARTPLRLGVAMTVLNVVLNVILIRGLGPIPAFGTKGAAMGSVIAAGAVAVYAFWLLLRGHLVIELHKGMRLSPDWQIIASLFRFGLPTGFQGIVMNLGGVLMLRFVGSLAASAEAQAVFTVGYAQLFSFITWTSNALMGAAAAVAGQNLGAERPERTRGAPWAAAGLGMGLAVPVGALFLAFPEALLGIFGMESPEVLALGSQLLAWLSVSGIFLTTALCFTGALQGTGDTKSPFYISLVSQIVIPLGYCALMDWTHGLRPTDIWLAILLGHLTRAALSVFRFQQGRWSHIEVEIAEEGA